MNPSASRDWAAIKRAYLTSDMTIGDICRTYCVNTRTLYRKIKRENWPRRNDSGTSSGGDKPASGLALDLNQTALGRGRDNGATMKPDDKTLYSRLYKVVDGQMAEIEARLAQTRGLEGDASQGDASQSDRDARTLTTLVKLLEKLSELDPQLAQGGKKQKPALVPGEDGGDRNTNQLREDLTQRLNRLIQEQDQQK